MENNRHYCTPENAWKFQEWLTSRGGIAIWHSVNLSNPGASWSTPALLPDGTPYPKPTWQADTSPSRIVTDPAEVFVSVWKEVKRFHVAIRMGSQGLMLKCTDASSAKIRRYLDKYHQETGKDTTYRFDYNTQEAVIFVEDEAIPLAQYIAGHPMPVEG